jgi:uncharacterized protein (DUF488 family)
MEYVNTTLPERETEQIRLLDLLKKYKRIALTCFESDINRCHRKILAITLDKYHPVEKIIHI